MQNVTSSGACFRHVVFPDTPGRAWRVVDFAAPVPGRFVPVRDASRPLPAGRVLPGTHFETPAAPRESALSFEEREFIEAVLCGAGPDASAYRPEGLRRRLAACLRAVRAPSLRKARQALQEDPSLRRAARSALLIGVTSFFRDPQVFSVLASRVIPELARQGGPIRAWSAGCSNGLELYSLAIVLAEFGLLGRCRLLGTDCRGDAVEQARAGRFEADALRAVHADWADKYFTPAGGCFRVSDELRNTTEWRCEDLLHPSGGDASPRAAGAGGAGGFDLILCRNVAIYLKPAAADALWERLYAALRPGGVLVTGKAERPALAGLQPLAPCVFRKDGRAA